MKERDLNGDYFYGYLLFMAVQNHMGQFLTWIRELHNEDNRKKRTSTDQATETKKEVRAHGLSPFDI
jgi:hypothetical protein